MKKALILLLVVLSVMAFTVTASAENDFVGEKEFTFDFFYEWFTSVSSKDVLDSLFEDLTDRRAWAIENEKWDLACRTSLQIEYLVDLLPSKNGDKKENKSKGE